MTGHTAATRAAAARLRRRAAPPRAGSAPKDPCPTCGVELGRPHGTSRRIVVFTSDRGQFRWQCPDCRASWTERASTQAGSTTRGASADAVPAGQTSSNQTTLPTPSR